MAEKFQYQLYQLENKQSKGTKLYANTRCELEGKTCSKIFFTALVRQNM